MSFPERTASYFFENCKQVLLALEPNIAPENLEKKAQFITKVALDVVHSCPNQVALDQCIEHIKTVCLDHLPDNEKEDMKYVLQFYEKEKKAFIQKYLSDLKHAPDHETMTSIAHQSALHAINKAKKKRKETCNTCGTHNRLLDNQKSLLKKCSRCRSAMYCNETCQRKDWQKHKLTCL